MRQSESEVASPDIHHQSARAEEDEEDGYQDAGEDGEDGGEGYYNHVDEYAATGTRGMMNEEGSPSQGKKGLVTSVYYSIVLCLEFML
jgi:hypothetical protein